jgi:group I intron endonuclease
MSPILIGMGHIYQIRNILNNAVYIGSTLKRDPKHRRHRHFTDLRRNCHYNIHLQRAWNKYGESNFAFEIIEVTGDNVLEREQFHLDRRKLGFPKNLNYNLFWTAGSPQGRKWSAAMRKKLSIAHLGQKQTPEAKAKQMASWEEKCKNPYSFTSPDGVVYSNVRNLRAFAREHNIGITGRELTLLHRGKIRYFKKWTKTGIPLPDYKLISPNGTETRGTFLKELCKAAGINYKMIHKYCIKNNKPYVGWMASQIA